MTSSDNECVVCMEPCAEFSVSCCNGHKVCEKHYLHRAKAIYEEGRLAYHEDDVQRCFLCRTGIEDDEFSNKHHKVMKIVVADGIMKQMVKQGVLSEHWRNEVVRSMLLKRMRTSC